jgi:hypothetical protein
MTEEESHSESKSRAPKRRFGWRWALGAVALLFGWFCFYFLVPPSLDQEPMPEPNGYEYFIRAGGMVSYDRNLLTNYNDLAWARPIYDSNQLALAEFRRGMEFECRVPRLPRDEASWDLWYGEMRNARIIRVVLRAESVLLRSAERHEQVARCGLEMIRFGHKRSRGGILLGASSSSLGIWAGEKILREERLELDARMLRSLCGELLKLDVKRESFDEILARDRNVNRLVYSDLEDIPGRLREFVDLESKRYVRLHFESMHMRSRLLIVELALEAYQKETGAYPRELSELTPGVLKEMPQDLFGNSVFGYVRNAEGYILYSYGPDGVDDGGELIDTDDKGQRNPKGDVTFDRW